MCFERSVFQEVARVRAAGGVVMMGRVGGQLAVSRAFGDFSLKNDVKINYSTLLSGFFVFFSRQCSPKS